VIQTTGITRLIKERGHVQSRPRRPQFSSRSEGSNANVTSAIGMEETVGHLRTRRNSLFARTVLGITGLVCAAFLLGTLTQAWSNGQLTQKVQVANQSLQTTQAINQNLKTQTQHYQDPAVIEREAREQMGYVRPGEHAVIVANEGNQKPAQTQQNKNSTQPQNYWQQWWKVFFG
jgi:cell division protein FtsB